LQVNNETKPEAKQLVGIWVTPVIYQNIQVRRFCPPMAPIIQNDPLPIHIWTGCCILKLSRTSGSSRHPTKPGCSIQLTRRPKRGIGSPDCDPLTPACLLCWWWESCCSGGGNHAVPVVKIMLIWWWGWQERLEKVQRDAERRALEAKQAKEAKELAKREKAAAALAAAQGLPSAGAASGASASSQQGAASAGQPGGL
jgi:hypothetical protein